MTFETRREAILSVDLLRTFVSNRGKILFLLEFDSEVIPCSLQVEGKRLPVSLPGKNRHASTRR